MTVSDGIQKAVEKATGGPVSRCGSSPIVETFRGETVWEGIVEVFELHGHPKAPKAYAWAYETDNPKKPRHVTVLHMGPVTSPLLAVRAAIVKEFRDIAAIEEA